MAQKRSNSRRTPIFGHRVIARNSVILSPISKRKVSPCSGHKGEQVEYLGSWLWPIFQYSDFRAQKWAWPPRGTKLARRSQNPSRSSVTGWVFLVNHYLDNDFSKFSKPKPPPLIDFINGANRLLNYGFKVGNFCTGRLQMFVTLL